MSTCVWRNKITLPPCFNAAQTCSSSACACPVESVSRTNRQRSKEAVRLIEWVSIGSFRVIALTTTQVCPLTAHCGHSTMSHLMSVSGVKRTWPIALHMSAFDPKRTLWAGAIPSKLKKKASPRGIFMAEGRVDRRLAAVLAGDVAGYSRLMGADEEGTLSRLNAHRREFLEPKVAEHRGRIVK